MLTLVGEILSYRNNRCYYHHHHHHLCQSTWVSHHTSFANAPKRSSRLRHSNVSRGYRNKTTTKQRQNNGQNNDKTLRERLQLANGRRFSWLLKDAVEGGGVIAAPAHAFCPPFTPSPPLRPSSRCLPPARLPPTPFFHPSCSCSTLPSANANSAGLSGSSSGSCGA